jgi:hypothetical protein
MQADLVPEAHVCCGIAQDYSAPILQAQQLAQLCQTAEHVWVRIDHLLVYGCPRELTIEASQQRLSFNKVSGLF